MFNYFVGIIVGIIVVAVIAVDVAVQPVGCDGCKWTIKRWRASTCSKFVDVVQPRVVSH